MKNKEASPDILSTRLTELIEASLTTSLDQDESAPVANDEDCRQMVSTGRVLPLICKRQNQYTIYRSKQMHVWLQEKNEMNNNNQIGLNHKFKSLKSKSQAEHTHYIILSAYLPALPLCTYFTSSSILISDILFYTLCFKTMFLCTRLLLSQDLV